MQPVKLVKRGVEIEVSIADVPALLAAGYKKVPQEPVKTDKKGDK